ncbi:MAG: VWA domain-containing protein [Terracidiphilus sp.]
MPFTRFAAASLAGLFMLSCAAFAQSPQPILHPPPPSTQPPQTIKLDVVVENKSGQPLTALQQQDFTVFDNKAPRPITSFKLETPKEEPVEVIIYLDAVNTPYELLAQIRNGTDKYFKENEGTLAHPTTFAFLTDDGAQFNKQFSSNGMKLSDDLEHDPVGLRQILRGAQWSDIDRFDIGIKAIHQLIGLASKLPGRKVVIFVSPGFPLLSGPTAQLTSKQQRQIFSDAVYLSTELRRNNVTFYNINPLGVSQPMFGANYYENFLKGLSRLDDAQFASLSPQVLSPQSGGLTLTSNNDIASMIQRCLLDVASWYRITFDPLPSEKPNDYHHIEVRVTQPHAIVRTRDGYYANPTPVAVQ